MKVIPMQFVYAVALCNSMHNAIEDLPRRWVPGYNFFYLCLSMHFMAPYWGISAGG